MDGRDLGVALARSMLWMIVIAAVVAIAVWEISRWIILYLWRHVSWT